MAKTLKGRLAVIQTNLGSANVSTTYTVEGKLTDLETASVDVDLAAGKIKTGVTIFGVTGTYDTEAGTPIAAATVLTGKKGWVNGALVTGTMANNAGDVASVSAHMAAGTNLHVVPAAGFTDGVDDATTVDLAVVDTDLVVGKIKAGVTILGVLGTYETVLTGDAVVANVLNGKLFYKDNAVTQLTGTMPNNAGAVACVSASITAGTTLSVIPATGFTDGTDDTSTIDLTTVDADLVTGNIKAGVTILGVAGKTEVVDTTEAVNAAVAANITAGKFAWVNGVRIEGTLI